MPRGWPEHVRSGILHAIGLAHTAITLTRSWAVNSRIARVRLAGENDSLKTEVALLSRELDLLRARFERIPAKNRPHFSPPQRLEVLELKAARAWSNTELARRLLLAPSTIAGWLKRLDEHGEQALVRLPGPVNRFPDLVTRLVHDLSALIPTMGKRRLAQLLARAGLHLSATTLRRMQQRARPAPPDPESEPGGPAVPTENERSRPPVAAKSTHHTWHCDLTVMPISSGLWAPWFPFALPTFWPFSWHVAVIIDHFSRRLVAIDVFPQEPSAAQMLRFLDTAVASAGRAPKYIITDRGMQFRSDYVDWCAQHGTKPRFGALGRKGAIAIAERFILSLKTEALRRILVPMKLEAMREQVIAYAHWYNSWRPHQSLGGRTPDEVCSQLRPARDRPRFETRRSYPTASGVELRAEPGTALTLVVNHEQGLQHLPTVVLRPAA